MKYLKSYEHSIKDEPQIGDSVICKDIENEQNQLNIFLLHNIGTIFKIESSKGYQLFTYVIQYDNIPDHLTEFFDLRNKTRHFSRKEILQFTPQLNKFNL